MTSLILLLALPAAASTSTLTLEGAVRAALEASPEVRAAQRRRDEAALEEPSLTAELDPRFKASYNYADDRSPRAAPLFQGVRSRDELWETALEANTLLGTRARVAWRNDRLSNATPFRPLDPTVDSRLNLELTQSLWRYFWGRPDLARRRRARAGVAAADAALRRARDEAAAGAAKAFLEWRQATALVGVREGGVADAKRLLAKYEDKARYGLAEDGDLLQAKANLELQETELLVARSRANLARHALLAALRLPEDAVLPAAEPAPPSAPAPLDALPEDEAVSRRPDLEEARGRRDRAEWELRIARLDTLPELDLKAGYGFAGLDTRYSTSWRDMSSWRHPAASIGAALTVPLGFARERLTRRAAQARLDAASADAAAVETRARRERRDAAEALRLSRARLAAARRLTDLQRRKFAAEEAQFKRGRSTTDLLLRFQNDIRAAEAELLRAEADEALARVDLARASGRLAEEVLR